MIRLFTIMCMSLVLLYLGLRDLHKQKNLTIQKTKQCEAAGTVMVEIVGGPYRYACVKAKGYQ